MSFDFSAESLADALTPFLEVRPTITVEGDCLIIGEPLPLRVVVTHGDDPSQFEVRLFQQVSGLPFGVACLAANEVNFTASAGARVRPVPDADRVLLAFENGVSGPISAGEDFGLAIRSVLDAVTAFHAAVERYFALRSVDDRLDELTRAAMSPSAHQAAVPGVADESVAAPTPLRAVPAPVEARAPVPEPVTVDRVSVRRPAPGYL